MQRLIYRKDFLKIILIICFITTSLPVWAKLEKDTSAPNFKYTDSTGKQKELSEVKGKKIVLLYFWGNDLPNVSDKPNEKGLKDAELISRRYGSDVLVLKIKIGFKITEQSLESLKLEGVPDDVLENLQSLKNRDFTVEEEFLDILKKIIGDEQTVRFQSLILKHAFISDPSVKEYVKYPPDLPVWYLIDYEGEIFDVRYSNPGVKYLDTKIVSIKTEQLSKLIVSFTPPDADVFLNESPIDLKGKNPIEDLTIENIKPGTYTLKIVKAGYQTRQEIISLSRGDVKKIQVNLVKNPGILDVRVKPDNSVVYLNGKREGATPLLRELTPGKYKLQISNDDGYYDWTGERIIDSEQPTVLDFQMDKHAILEVTSTPSYAEVLIDDKSMGITPVNKKGLPLGEHTIKVQKVNHHTYTKLVTLKPGTKVSVTAKLEPMLGTLDITSTPPGAKIHLDNEPLEQVTPTQLEMFPGKYTLALRIPDYEPYTTQVQVTDKKMTMVEAVLLHITSLTVISNPSGAQVRLGNFDSYTTPASIKPLPPGNYELTIRLKGHRTVHRKIEITPHKNNELKISLLPKRRKEILLRSLLLPGLGQYYGEHYKTATLFFLTELGATVGFAVTQTQYMKAVDRYDKAVAAYQTALTLDEIQQTRQAMLNEYNPMNSKRTQRRFALSAMIGLWGLNLAHAYFTTPNKTILPMQTTTNDFQFIVYTASNESRIGICYRF